MTFTSTTIRKLRALNLEQHIFDAILEIFEEAKEAKPKKKGGAADRQERGTRLPSHWDLPDTWRKWALSIGLSAPEVNREATKFKNYWLNAAGAKGVKLKWDLTWQNWCLGMLERAGRQPIQVDAAKPAADGPETFPDKTWAAIAKRWKSTGQWNPEWGPPPDRIDCKMPESYL